MNRDLLTFLKDRKIFFSWQGSNKNRHYVTRAERRAEERLTIRKPHKKPTKK